MHADNKKEHCKNETCRLPTLSDDHRNQPIREYDLLRWSHSVILLPHTTHSIHAIVLLHSPISFFPHSLPYVVSLVRMTFFSLSPMVQFSPLAVAHFSSKNGVGKGCATTISFSAVTLYECIYSRKVVASIHSLTSRACRKQDGEGGIMVFSPSRSFFLFFLPTHLHRLHPTLSISPSHTYKNTHHHNAQELYLE